MASLNFSEEPTTETVLDLLSSIPEVDANLFRDVCQDDAITTKTRFFRQFLERVLDSVNSESPLNDTVITCGPPDAFSEIRLPALLLASICPVFRTTGILSESENQGMIIPELSADDLRVFLKHLCQYKMDTLNVGNIEDEAKLKSLEDDMKSIQRVMDILCVDFHGSDDPVDSLFLLDNDWVTSNLARGGIEPSVSNPRPAQPTASAAVSAPPASGEMNHRRRGRKRGRPKKSVDEEPYVKTEVMETFRTTAASYSLRQTIKRKRFSDLISEPSDLDEDDDDMEEKNLKPKKKRARKMAAFENFESDSDVYQPEADAGDDYEEDELIDEKDLHVEDELVQGVEQDHGEKTSRPNHDDSKSNEMSPRDENSTQFILVCSRCQYECEGQAAMRRHAAKDHPGSKLFQYSPENPHHNCITCVWLLKSYENFFRENDGATSRQLCFPCPHCRRRYLGSIGGLTTHLMTDHRNSAIHETPDKDESYFKVMRRDSEEVLTCDFCSKVFATTVKLNKHLLSCPENSSGHSAGLFCHICGKMFVQQRNLKDHIERHGKDNVSRERNFFCPECPVTCVSEANLARHVEREHADKNFDENFVLHENCERCSQLMKSYLENKKTKTISFREMVFKCPHCCTVLYANPKHPPRYLYNHVNRFHVDPEINDFSLGSNDPDTFRLRSKSDDDALICDFCDFKSTTRTSHNVHLSTCKANTVPCRPGYMCDSCGFIAGTAVHLRDHLETHNEKNAYSCNECKYTGRSHRYLKAHIRNHHSNQAKKISNGHTRLPCPKVL